jgi:hypothetical protein
MQIKKKNLNLNGNNVNVINAIECSFLFSSQTVADRIHVHQNFSTQNDAKSMQLSYWTSGHPVAGHSV